MLTGIVIKFWTVLMMMGIVTVFLFRSQMAMRFTISCLARLIVILDEDHRHAEAVSNLEGFEEHALRASDNSPLCYQLIKDLEDSILAKARPDSLIAAYIRG